MIRVHKEYAKPFLLEPTKLTRIIDKIHERLGDHQCTTMRDHFEVVCSGKQRVELNSVDAVLAIDNVRKHKILRLVITCSAGRKNATLLEHEIKVDFGGQGIGSNPASKGVAISVSSDAVGWPSRTLSELEEQVERTWLPYLHIILILCAILVGELVLLFFQLPLSFAPRALDETRAMWLRERDLDRVEQILGQGRPITAEEMRDITTRQLHNILEEYRPKRSAKKGLGRKTWSLVIPLAILVVCGFILLATCYPTAVFLWGDEVQRYANVLQRRKVLWSIIIGVPIIGLLANILIIGVESWLPAE